MNADHPRRIDRYIDFFGDRPGTTLAEVPAGVPCARESAPGAGAAAEESRPRHPEC